MPRQPQRPLQYAPRRQPFPVGPADEGEFDFSRPFLVDIGRAAVIAEYLRESRCPRRTAEVVTEELAQPERRRALRRRSAEESRMAALSLAPLLHAPRS